MNNVDSRKIQKYILDALIVKAKGSSDLAGLKDQQVRTICKTLSAEEDNWVYYNCFLPLVRVGLIECVQTKEGSLQSRDTLRWVFSKPAVFHKARAEKRQWIGLNLTEEMIDSIPSEYELQNDESDPLYSYIVTWETPLTYKGDGLPVRDIPSPEALLKSVYPLPCSPDYFAWEDEHSEIERYNEVYNDKTWKFDKFDTMKGARTDGLYQYVIKFAEKKFSDSHRIYYSQRKTYSLNPDPDSETWARIMHCIDNKFPVVEYYLTRKTLTFRQPVPILLGRILFTNQMFSDMECPEIPRQEYRGVSLAVYNELLRIFSNNGNKRGE